uniref:Uncharacterized protein LOC114344531 n=1 Tax=Diabrotica virgifera virgifera TaxID=50390 RepID=A0A6P7H0B0_DIAVI
MLTNICRLCLANTDLVYVFDKKLVKKKFDCRAKMQYVIFLTVGVKPISFLMKVNWTVLRLMTTATKTMRQRQQHLDLFFIDYHFDTYVPVNNTNGTHRAVHRFNMMQVFEMPPPKYY